MRPKKIPYFSASDLSDAATPERVDRLWNAIEADLVERLERSASAAGMQTPVSSPWRASWGWMLAATAVACSTMGLVAGKFLWEKPELGVRALPFVPVVQAPVVSEAPAVVWAAGTDARSYSLPQGGELRLGPGSTVEWIDKAAGSGGATRADPSSLLLVQGEVTIAHRAADSNTPLRLVAGEMALTIEHDSVVHVRRGMDVVDVSVAQGAARVRSPDGEHRVAGGESLFSVPLRRTASHARVVSAAAPRVDDENAASAVAASGEVAAPAAVVSDWLAKARSGDVREAYRLLSSKPGGVDGAIRAATDAEVLWDVHDVAIGQDPSAAHRALIRVAQDFPNDASAQLAAYKLGNYYRKEGMHEQANRWFARTANQSEGVLAEDALCKQFRTDPSPERALTLAKDYLSRYPDGRCRAAAERVVAKGASVGQGSAGADGTLALPTDDEDEPENESDPR